MHRHGNNLSQRSGFNYPIAAEVIRIFVQYYVAKIVKQYFANSVYAIFTPTPEAFARLSVLNNPVDRPRITRRGVIIEERVVWTLRHDVSFTVAANEHARS